MIQTIRDNFWLLFVVICYILHVLYYMINISSFTGNCVLLIIFEFLVIVGFILHYSDENDDEPVIFSMLSEKNNET